MNRIVRLGAVVLLVTGAACAGGDDGTEDGAAAEDSVARPQGPQELITVWESEELAYVADENGEALYVLEGDPEGASACYDECAAKWKPVLYRGGAVGAKGANRQALVSSFERTDGAEQLSYGGHALYHKVANSRTLWEFEDEFGRWLLLQPSGEPLTEVPEGD